LIRGTGGASGHHAAIGSANIVSCRACREDRSWLSLLGPVRRRGVHCASARNSFCRARRRLEPLIGIVTVRSSSVCGWLGDRVGWPGQDRPRKAPRLIVDGQNTHNLESDDPADEADLEKFRTVNGGRDDNARSESRHRGMGRVSDPISPRRVVLALQRTKRGRRRPQGGSRIMSPRGAGWEIIPAAITVPRWRLQRDDRPGMAQPGYGDRLTIRRVR